jgi:hypothetical protein
VKALGCPGRCGLLRKRSRMARLQPADAIGRGALSGAQALRARGRPRTASSNGVLNEAGAGRGLGSPLRCQRVYVKFTLAKCGSGGWPGPHYFFVSFYSRLFLCRVFAARITQVVIEPPLLGALGESSAYSAVKIFKSLLIAGSPPSFFP